MDTLIKTILPARKGIENEIIFRSATRSDIVGLFDYMAGIQDNDFTINLITKVYYNTRYAKTGRFDAADVVETILSDYSYPKMTKNSVNIITKRKLNTHHLVGKSIVLNSKLETPKDKDYAKKLKQKDWNSLKLLFRIGFTMDGYRIDMSLTKYITKEASLASDSFRTVLTRNMHEFVRHLTRTKIMTSYLNTTINDKLSDSKRIKAMIGFLDAISSDDYFSPEIELEITSKTIDKEEFKRDFIVALKHSSINRDDLIHDARMKTQLEYRQIVNNPIPLNHKALVMLHNFQVPVDGVGYSVTYKKDGERMMIYSTDFGVMFMATSTSVDTAVSVVPPITVIDAELINDTIVLFDCSVRDSNEVQSDHKDRVKWLTGVAKKISNVRPCIVSTFYYPTKAKPLSKICADLWNPKRIESLDYDVDGLIFTPLKHYSDTIYKWKPVKYLTVDFLVSFVRSRGVHRFYTLYCTANRRGEPGHKVFNTFPNVEMVPFQPRSTNPNIRQLEILRPLDNHTTYELAWNGKKWVVHRQRPGKYPNKLSVANETFNLIRSPITIDNITNPSLVYKPNIGHNALGKDLRDMKQFHRTVKYNIYTDYISNDRAPIKMLLDIGSGTGGDIKKWFGARFTRVVGIEPNADSIRQSEERFTTIMSDPRFKEYTSDIRFLPINMTLEDFFKSSEYADLKRSAVKFDYVTSFFSIHYYLTTKRRYDELFKYLRPLVKTHARFIIVTLDGKRVLERFKRSKTNRLGHLADPSDMNTYMIELVGKPKKSIVSNVIRMTSSSFGTPMEEHLVDFELLKLTAPKYGWKMVPRSQKPFSKYFTKASYMTRAFKTVSFLNSCIVFEAVDT